MTTSNSLFSVPNIPWPQSPEMAASMQRLKELEEIRKQRQATRYSHIGDQPTDAGTRMSRRQQIVGRSLRSRSQLQSGPEEKRKSFLGRRTLDENRNMSMSQGDLDSPGYGGARPKNFDALSLQRNTLTKQEGNYIGRERSSSLTNSEDSQTSPLFRSQSLIGLETNQSTSNGHIDIPETEPVLNTSISEDEDDIESFKRSLYGIKNLADVPEKEEPILKRQTMPSFNRTVKEIDTSKLLIHKNDSQDRVSSFPSGERAFQNVLSERMKNLESLFSDRPKSDERSIQDVANERVKNIDSLFSNRPNISSSKSETLPRIQRFSSRSERINSRQRGDILDHQIEPAHGGIHFDDQSSSELHIKKDETYITGSYTSENMGSVGTSTIYTSENVGSLSSDHTNNNENIGEVSSEQIYTSENKNESSVEQINTGENIGELSTDQTNSSENMEKCSSEQTYTSENIEEHCTEQTYTSENTIKPSVEQTQTSENVGESDTEKIYTKGNIGEMITEHRYISKNRDKPNAELTQISENERQSDNKETFTGENKAVHTSEDQEDDILDDTNLGLFDPQENNQSQTFVNDIEFFDTQSTEYEKANENVELSESQLSQFQTFDDSVGLFESRSDYNTGLFEQQKNFGINSDHLSDFSHFSNQQDFLNYDQSVRQESDISHSLPDRFSSRSYRSTSIDNTSSFRGHPYSNKRNSDASGLYSSSSSLGQTYLKLSEDTSSKMDEIFQKQESKLENLMSTLPTRRSRDSRTRDSRRASRPSYSRTYSDTNTRSEYKVPQISEDTLKKMDELFSKKTDINVDLFAKVPERRNRDSLVDTRSSISRRHSDVGDMNEYQSTRSGLYRSYSNFRPEPSSLFQTEELQTQFVPSFLDESNFMSREEEISSRMDEIRNRVRTNAALNIQGRSFTSSESRSYNRFNSLQDVRSEAPDFTSEKLLDDEEMSGETSIVHNDLLSKINSLTSNILQDDFSNGDVDVQDSNKTLTPENEIDDILHDQNINDEMSHDQNEIDNADVTRDEEVLTFTSSCDLEIGQVLICSTPDIDKRVEGKSQTVKNDINDEKLSEASVVDSEMNINSSSEKIMEKHTIDDASVKKVKQDIETKSWENSDETDSKSISSGTTASNSSKKKKNKRKGKNNNNSDSKKIIVSHPSELFAKDKKAKKEQKKQQSEDVRKSEEKNVEKVKSSTKGDRSDIPSSNRSNNKKSPKNDGKPKNNKDEQTTPKKEKQAESDNDGTKSPSKLKKLFDSLIHGLDRKSETSSSQDDNQSQSSGEKTPVGDEWEIITDQTSDLNIIHEDNYATFSDEEFLLKKRKMSDEVSSLSTDNYETASDHTVSGGSEYEEFYEALPTELLGNDWKENIFFPETERKEQFVYICAGSKVRRKRKKVENANTKRSEKVDQWISNNLYPGDKYPEKSENVANIKFTNNKQLSVEKNDNDICEQIDKIDLSNKSISTEHSKSDCTEQHDEFAIIENSSKFDSTKLSVSPFWLKKNNMNKEPIQSERARKDFSHNNGFSTHAKSQISDDKSEIGVTHAKSQISDDKSEIGVIIEEKLKTIEQNEIVDNKQQLENTKVIEKLETNNSTTVEDVRLDLKASDDAFTDTLVKTLREKLCSCCQGVLLDALKQTYFTRYEEIAKINLTSSNLSTSSKDASKTENEISNGKKDESNVTDFKIKGIIGNQKAKKLKVEDLLYEKTDDSKVSDLKLETVQKMEIPKDDKPKTAENDTSYKQNSKQISPKTAKDNNTSVSNSNKNKETVSAQKSSGEIKIKGRVVSVDKRKIKEEKVTSPIREPRLCQQHAAKSDSTVSQESSKNNQAKTTGKEVMNSKPNNAQISKSSKSENTPASKTETKDAESDEYKLPHLKDNPFIKSDKLRKSVKKTENTKKPESPTKVMRRSTSVPNETFNGTLSPKARKQSLVEKLPVNKKEKSPEKEINIEKGSDGRKEINSKVETKVENSSSVKSNSETKQEKSANISVEKSEREKKQGLLDMKLNGDVEKNSKTDKKSESVKKSTSPSGSKKPSMFDHLSFAKSVCETLGPQLNGNNKDDSDASSVATTSSEQSGQETVTKKTKTPKKKKFSPFGGKRK